MPDDNDYTPFADLNTFHEVGNWVDSRTFFEPSNHHCGGDQLLNTDQDAQPLAPIAAILSCVLFELENQ